MTVNSLCRMMIECYAIAGYTNIFVSRRRPEESKYTILGIDEVETLNAIHNAFEKEFLEHYSQLAMLASGMEDDTIPDSYKVVDELGKTTIVESDNTHGQCLKITLERRPSVYFHSLDPAHLHWSPDFGKGCSEKFNMNCGSVIDGILGYSNG